MLDPVLPAQMPRGYGGIGIIWRKELDHMIEKIDDGGTRIQVVRFGQFENSKSLLIISVYLPTKGLQGNIEDFCDIIDQIREICLKFASNSYILIGGDLNENLKMVNSSRRQAYLRDFLSEFELKYTSAGETYVSPAGEDCSEIDYFLHNIKSTLVIVDKYILNDLYQNVSDHYPIGIQLSWERSTVVTQSKQSKGNKMNWKRADVDLYSAYVNEGLECLTHVSINESNINPVLNDLCNVMNVSAQKSCGTSRQYISKPKLRVWTPEIKQSLKTMKCNYALWKKYGKPTHEDNELYIKRNESKKYFRKVYRQTLANKDNEIKQRILGTRKYDSKTFHKLVNAQRKKGNSFITDLYVGEQMFKEDEILNGFKEHFEILARASTHELFDDEYHDQVAMELEHIEDIVSGRDIKPVTPGELKTAIKSINTGKSADFYNITIEHILNSYQNRMNSNTSIILLRIVNAIFESGQFPETLKVGVVTPIFKKKGHSNVSSNYRGITVLPVIGKIVESILRQRISPFVEAQQNNIQRGFTKNASPLNSAFIIEELYRESKDNKLPMNLVLLDAKSAFDVVDHNHLLRRLFHAGINDRHWSLINSFHTNCRSTVKWCNQTSALFNIHQGVRQGGILSTDLYKTYVNPLLNRLQNARLGNSIGNIRCAASACADDICLAARDNHDTQVLMNVASDFANMERYILQPTKSVHIAVNQKNSVQNPTFTINSREIPSVDQSTHLGIIRTSSIKGNQSANIDENMKKARRAAYSLFGSGLRGHEGLDIITIVHLYKTYVLPILLYGLELIQPLRSNIEKLEAFQKKFLKELLLLPNTTANAAVYLITGILSIEAQIHIKMLTFLYNLISQGEESIERQIVVRQYYMKSVDSSSWISNIQKVLWKYNLPSLGEILLSAGTRSRWKNLVNKSVSIFWAERINSVIKLYSSLKFFHEDQYIPGKVHPLFNLECTARETSRQVTKLRLATGTYILQTTRKKFNQHQVDSTCLLCNISEETVEHFILLCPALDSIRAPILADIVLEFSSCANIEFDQQNVETKTQCIINCWPSVKTKIKGPLHIHEVERQCNRLLFSLDCARIKMLSQVVSRRSKAHLAKPLCGVSAPTPEPM